MCLEYLIECILQKYIHLNDIRNPFVLNKFAQTSYKTAIVIAVTLCYAAFISTVNQSSGV